MPSVVIFDIKRFAVHDGPGIRTTVFFKGCPLKCWWCHNPESRDRDPVTVDVERKLNGKTFVTKKTYGERIETGFLMEILLRDRPFYEESGGGITVSGGEPLMQPEALSALLDACREEGLHTTIDTCGHALQEEFERIRDRTDLFLYDLKLMDPGLHAKYTGADNRLILSNADYLLDRGARVIFRIPVLPGINSSGKELEQMISYIGERRDRPEAIHLLPYHRIAVNKYARLGMKQHLSGMGEPDRALMESLKREYERTGLRVLIGG